MLLLQYPPFQEYLEIYMGLGSFITETHEGKIYPQML